MPDVVCPKIGDAVVYHDPYGVPFAAILTDVHGSVGQGYVPCVNLVYVSENKAERDDYGRQIKRQSSCSHKTNNQAHGNYFRYAHEEPNVGVPAQSRE